MSSVLIIKYRCYVADPITSIVISFFILASTWPLLKMSLKFWLVSYSPSDQPEIQ